MLSEDTRIKVRAALTREVIERIRLHNKTRKRSKEERANIGRAGKGRVVSEATRAKISAALSGRKKSNEHIQKVAASQQGRKCSAETRVRISQAKKTQWEQGIYAGRN